MNVHLRLYEILSMSTKNYVAIMAGGVGSRFWPSSRESRPKQFLDITDSGNSLLQQTVERLEGLVPLSNILIVSNKKYKEQILQQLPLIHANQLLLEPSRNNTAPCVAYTALHLQSIDEDAVFAMLPADHVIKNVAAFQDALNLGFEKAAKSNSIVTLGIEPTKPDTGYGYIHYDSTHDMNGIHAVKSFKEKPDRATAESYLKQGDYVWNAGIFIWSVQTILKQFSISASEILKVLTTDLSKFGTEQEQSYIDEVYPKTKKISVDFAILEHADNVFTIPVDIGWSDLGTWNSLYGFLEKDSNENVVLSNHAFIEDGKGNLVRVKDDNKLIVMKGLSNFIIVDEGDVLLIYPRDKEQEIKQIKQKIKGSDFE